MTAECVGTTSWIKTTCIAAKIDIVVSSAVALGVMTARCVPWIETTGVAAEIDVVALFAYALTVMTVRCTAWVIPTSESSWITAIAFLAAAGGALMTRRLTRLVATAIRAEFHTVPGRTTVTAAVTRHTGRSVEC